MNRFTSLDTKVEEVLYVQVNFERPRRVQPERQEVIRRSQRAVAITVAKMARVMRAPVTWYVQVTLSVFCIYSEVCQNGVQPNEQARASQADPGARRELLTSAISRWMQTSLKRKKGPYKHRPYGVIG